MGSPASLKVEAAEKKTLGAVAASVGPHLSFSFPPTPPPPLPVCTEEVPLMMASTSRLSTRGGSHCTRSGGAQAWEETTSLGRSFTRLCCAPGTRVAMGVHALFLQGTPNSKGFAVEKWPLTC